MSFFAFIAALLFLLALLDLAVGVSNDAVNFLNSAIGSRVARRRTILLVASTGILLGALTSSGMMEVARKGVFHPEMFSYADIMVLFLAVMLADVLLLDAFNSLALPTSTTVSIVFELLGAAVALALFGVCFGNTETGIGDYINGSQAVAIIGGIFLSVGIAFLVGAAVQFLTRLSFTFRLDHHNGHPLRLAWAALSMTALSYFLLIKGLGSAPFLPAAVPAAIETQGAAILPPMILFWLLVLAVLGRLGVDVLRISVLFGTFALAMAFAGNDLVNFIGVPLAGMASFRAWAQSGAAPDELSMAMLAEPVRGETHWLLLAGAVMAVTLWLSARARAVTDTEVSLGRQDAGAERFRAGPLSRALVRGWLHVAAIVAMAIPAGWARKMALRLDPPPESGDSSRPAFDLVRASANLTVASVLIAMATSMGLPLSTTYVSFMVAMGTSLADGAWGGDSAVYRVAGVLSVMGGWFLTAAIAFTTAAVFAFVMRSGGATAIGVLLVLAGWQLYRTRVADRLRTAAAAVPGSHGDSR